MINIILGIIVLVGLILGIVIGILMVTSKPRNNTTTESFRRKSRQEIEKERINSGYYDPGW